MTDLKAIIAATPGLGEWSILRAYRGSTAQGTFVIKESDKDIISVCVPPESFYIGLDEFGSRGTQDKKIDEYDIVIYELRKFVHLLMKGNPNLLSVLWTAPQYFMHTTPAGQLLIDNRNLFVGRHVFYSFAGYANGQLHRMTHPAEDSSLGEKRRKQVEQFGYSPKNASQLIMLLRMCSEFLSTGELIVLRPDNNQLLEIKNGEWSLDRVKAEADHQYKRAEAAFDRSTLPLKPDYGKINDLCVQVVKTARSS